MESSYLTVDFFRKLPLEFENGPAPSPATDRRAVSADRRNPPSDRGMPSAERGNPTDPLGDRYGDAHFRRIGSNVSSYISMVSDTLKVTIPKAVVYCQVKEARNNLLHYFYTQIGRKELGELLDEDPSLMSQRQELGKRLELYKGARDEIDSAVLVR
nr:dynamin-related protein 1E-like [Tanacetum cinerariifolium]